MTEVALIEVGLSSAEAAALVAESLAQLPSWPYGWAAYLMTRR